MYVFIYTIHTHKYIFKHTWIRHTHTYKHTHIHTCTYECACYIRTHIHTKNIRITHTFTSINTYMHICIYICVKCMFRYYIYLHTYLWLYFDLANERGKREIFLLFMPPYFSQKLRDVRSDAKKIFYKPISRLDQVS